MAQGEVAGFPELAPLVSYADRSAKSSTRWDHAERLVNAYRQKHAGDPKSFTESMRVARAVGALARLGTSEANQLLPSLAENVFFLPPMSEDERRRRSRDTVELEGIVYAAIRDLEANGTPEAQQVLKMIAPNAASDRLKREAKEALERLARLAKP